ncbi:trehalose-phosphatase [Oceaniovalibus guishaninsula JLT2003]|uniref:Trehalose 6-phosphate phosphatase n=1 Tax=Oceaniovalibus guishaninsula JLT2003 TaxID=1231392 RepID=K2I8A3_9RHOB|nr:trehalose-phosphatase [Oceaniovalibus guishaninsula]EKE45270.1 trehalose-phosphatase [Oceaniovalibus guishaninsula JLT2003]
MPEDAPERYDRPEDIPMPEFGRTALFLDFDGVLVDLADRPDAVRVEAQLAPLLLRLDQVFGGGTTLLSGRGLADLERMLPGTGLDMVGGHGAERRQRGTIQPHAFADDPRLSRMKAELHDWAATRPGLLVEDKATGVVVHYRAAPERTDEVRARLTEMLANQNDLDLHPSKMADEIRPADANKGAGLRRAMQDTAADRAVMIGDDLTDEPAMEAALQTGGMAIKVGPGPTVAPLRLRDVAAVHALLARWSGAR